MQQTLHASGNVYATATASLVCGVFNISACCLNDLKEECQCQNIFMAHWFYFMTFF